MSHGKVSVPPSINAAVLDLCRRVHASNLPVYVVVKPDETANERDCFVNVRRKVEREGGRIQFGWAIWQQGRYFIEAEHHAVYAPPDDQPCIDVTPPPQPGINRILFLPDDEAVFDFSSDQLRDNIRMPLLDDDLVREFCDVSAKKTNLLNSLPGFGALKISGEMARKLEWIEFRKAVLMAQIEARYAPNPSAKIRRNELCPCGSGRKYKRCCGASV